MMYEKKNSSYHLCYPLARIIQYVIASNCGSYSVTIMIVHRILTLIGEEFLFEYFVVLAEFAVFAIFTIFAVFEEAFKIWQFLPFLHLHAFLDIND